MTPTDTFSQRIEAAGIVLIALLVVGGSGWLLNGLITGASPDQRVVLTTAIVGLISGALGTVLGFFFSKQASAQGAHTTNGTTAALASLLQQQAAQNNAAAAPAQQTNA